MTRTRFAPSPTGSLHVGGARTALYCLLQARKQGGRFLLRIEDTDQARSTEAAAEGILRDLRWLGLDWDEGPQAESGTGPYFQSQRIDLYNQYVDQLLASGHAYFAWDSVDELAAMRDAAESAKSSFRYRQMAITPEQEAAYRAEGRTPVVRLAAPKHDIHVTDDILGTVTVTADELEDIVIRKRDGFPTYHFAVVIDDHFMGVTQVLRGQEHLMNTPKHIGLYDAFGWSNPSHGHLPLIFNTSGGKMSKRDKAKAARSAAQAEHTKRGEKTWAWLASATGLPIAEITGFVQKTHDSVSTAESIAAFLGIDLPMIEVMDFRKGGYLPEALLNYLALLGWSPGGDREIMTVEEMIGLFNVGDINKSAAKFDAVKLTAMNAEHIRRSSIDRLMEVFASWIEVTPDSHFAGMAPERQRIFLEMYQSRMTTFCNLERQARFFFVRPITWDASAVAKYVRKGDLCLVRTALNDLADWSVPGIDAVLTSMGKSEFAQPLRVAVTGTAVSPGIADTLSVLGKDEVLTRIDGLLATL